jgi:hypothetical protein
MMSFQSQPVKLGSDVWGPSLRGIEVSLRRDFLTQRSQRNLFFDVIRREYAKGIGLTEACESEIFSGGIATEVREEIDVLRG